jgi:hypothetical protein
VPDIEFLPDEGGEYRPDLRPRTPRDRRRLAVGALGAAVFLTAVVVAVVVGNGAKPIPKARPAANPSVAPAEQTSTLALPVSVAFGPASVDVLSVGNRVYSLTPTLIGMAGRDGGAAVVRAAPLGLSAPIGYGELVADLDHRLLWVVDIGGNAIASYDMDHLDPVSSSVSRYPINGAVAMDEQLWFTTDRGLYTAVAGPGAPRLVPHTRHALWSIAADRTLHRLLVVTQTTPARLIAISTYGPVAAVTLPLSDVTSIAYPNGALWLAGMSATGPQLLLVDPPKLRVRGDSPVIAQVGSRPRIVGAFENKLLVRGGDDGRSLYCLDGYSGAVKQRWTVPLGAVTLNETGLLVDAEAGIEELNARACLAA